MSSVCQNTTEKLETHNAGNQRRCPNRRPRVSYPLRRGYWHILRGHCSNIRAGAHAFTIFSNRVWNQNISPRPRGVYLNVTYPSQT